MKAVALLLVFCCLALSSSANNPYRNYLLSKIYIQPRFVETYQPTYTPPPVGAGAFIPRFERPRGAVFCRMEDMVTKATKVWLKIGVQ